MAWQKPVLALILGIFLLAGCVTYTPYSPKLPWEGLYTGTGAGNVSCGVALDTAGATYTMNASSSINGSNCFSVTASNITLNCNGFSIFGNNTTSTYGIYTNKNGTIIKNCNVAGFYDAVVFDGAAQSSFSNGSARSTTTALWIKSGSIYTNISDANVSTTLGISGIYVQAAGAIINRTTSAGIYISTQNITIDGSRSNATAASQHGLYADGGKNITILNSVFQGTMNGIRFANTTTSIFNNVTAIGTGDDGMIILGASNNNIINNSLGITTIVAAGINLESSSNNKVLNSVGNGRGAAISIMCMNGHDNVNPCWNNTLINVTGNALGGIHAFQSFATAVSVVNNTVIGSNFIGDFYLSNVSGYSISNNTINAVGNASGMNIYKATNNTFINNTLSNATTLLKFSDALSSNNIFCLNNFSNVGSPTLYVNDTNGSNYYNCTYDSKNQGNVYENVLNRSIGVLGGVPSSVSGLYIGTSGVGVPYNNSTSGGKFSCNFAGCADYAPLAPPKVAVCGDALDTAGMTYVMNASSVAGDSDCFAITTDNITLDCQGYNMSSTYNGIFDRWAGIHNYANNVTIKNCVVIGFPDNIAVQGSNSRYTNLTLYTNSSLSIGSIAIHVWDAFNNTISKTRIIGDTGWYGINIGVGSFPSTNNTFDEINETEVSFPFYAFSGINTTIKNSHLTGYQSIEISNTDGTKILNTSLNSREYTTIYNTKNTLIANSSTSYDTVCAESGWRGFDMANNNGTLFINNTFCVSGDGMVVIMSGSSENERFCLNNLTQSSRSPSAPIVYSAASMTNTYFNCTYDGKNQGNIWSTVMDNSTPVTGKTNSSVAGLYIGRSGAVPFNSSNSNDLILGNIVDYAPLTPYYGPSVMCGDVLSTAGASYTLTSNLAQTGSGDCLIVSAPNVTINCAGHSIIGNNANFNGVYSNQDNTTIKNCVISNFSNGILYSGATQGNIMNVTVNTTYSTGYGIHISGGYLNTISGSNITCSGYEGVITETSTYNTVTGSTIRGIGSSAAIAFTGGNNNIVSTSNVSADSLTLTLLSETGDTIANNVVRGSSDEGAVTVLTSSSNTIENNTINGLGGKYAIYLWPFLGPSLSNRVGNNTMLNTTVALLHVEDPTNTFYLNNFTNTSGMYVEDIAGGGNFYYANISGKNQGNVYYNVLNGTIKVNGTVNSSIAGLYIGTNGTGVPYGTSNSGGKFSSSDSDPYPLTPYYLNGITTYNLTILAGTGGTALGNATGLTVPTTSLINATANANYQFVNWTVLGTGCSVLNATNNVTSANLTVGNCNVTANFATICRTLGTGTYTMPASVTSATTCFTAGASSAVLDCNGYSITGDNSNNHYAVYSTQSGTVVKNCNISNFDMGIYYVGVDSGAITNNTIAITSNHVSDPIYSSPIELRATSTSNTIANNTLTTVNGVGVLLYSYCDANILTNNTIGSGWIGYWVSASINNVFSGGSINGSNGAAYFTSAATGNTIANSTINGYGGVKGLEFQDTSSSNFVTNNTFRNATVLLSFTANATGNTISLNNFTNIGNPTLYVNDTNGSNYFNTTIYSLNQGNIWGNVVNGSVVITGTNNSSIAGYYLGAAGAGYPYNNTTASGKLVGRVVDWAPLTQVLTGVAGSNISVWNVSINATSANNLTSDNLTCYYSSNASYNVTDFRVNGVSYAILNAPFDSNETTIKDYSTNNFSATSVNATWTAGGKTGGAYSFNGNGSYINFGNSSSLNIGVNHTIMAWINSSNVNKQYGMIIAKGGPNIANSSYEMRFSDTTGKIENYINSYPTVMSTAPLANNTWYHLATTFNGTTATLYINGAVNNSSAFTNTTITIFPYNLTLGARTDGYNYQGIIDDAMILNRTLTAAEIKAIYDAGVLGKHVETIKTGETAAGQNWSCAVTPMNNTFVGTAVLSNNLTIQATATLTSNLTVLCNTTQGTCTGNSTGFTIPANKTITASANANFTFANFSVTSGNGTINNTAVNSTFVIFLSTTGPTVVTANFNELAKANLSISVIGNGTAITNQTNVHVPALFNLNATPSVNWTFTNYTRTAGTCAITSATSANTTVNITVAENCNIAALFTDNPRGNITINAGTGGTATGSQTNVYLGNYSINATANANYVFFAWVRSAGTCIIANNTSAATTVNLFASENCVINASFSVATANLTVLAINGTATGNQTNVNIFANYSINSSALNSNYTFSSWNTTGNCTINAQTANTTVLLNGNCTATAYYAWNVTTPSMNISVWNVFINSTSGNNYTSDNLTCHYSSNASYNITDFRVNGVSWEKINLPFDANESVVDYSTNHLAAFDNSAVWSPYGKVGGGRFFSGSTSLSFADTSVLELKSAIAMTAWVNSSGDTYDDYQAIMSKDNEYLLRIDKSNHKVYCYIYVNGGWNGASSNHTMSTGTYQHFICQWNNATGLIQIYINGTLDGQSTGVIGSTAGGGAQLDIGMWQPGSNRLYGYMDEVIIFNRSLTQNQITALYSAGVNGKHLETIATGETVVGQNWSCMVTPANNTFVGIPVLSNNLTIAAGGGPTNTCTSPGSGNWTLNCADYCNVSNTTISIDYILYNGTGTTTFRNVTMAYKGQKPTATTGFCVFNWQNYTIRRSG